MELSKLDVNICMLAGCHWNSKIFSPSRENFSCVCFLPSVIQLPILKSTLKSRNTGARGWEQLASSSQALLFLLTALPLHRHTHKAHAGSAWPPSPLLGFLTVFAGTSKLSLHAHPWFLTAAAVSVIRDSTSEVPEVADGVPSTCTFPLLYFSSLLFLSICSVTLPYSRNGTKNPWWDLCWPSERKKFRSYFEAWLLINFFF